MRRNGFLKKDVKEIDQSSDSVGKKLNKTVLKSMSPAILPESGKDKLAKKNIKTQGKPERKSPERVRKLAIVESQPSKLDALRDFSPSRIKTQAHLPKTHRAKKITVSDRLVKGPISQRDVSPPRTNTGEPPTKQEINDLEKPRVVREPIMGLALTSYSNFKIPSFTV